MLVIDCQGTCGTRVCIRKGKGNFGQRVFEEPGAVAYLGHLLVTTGVTRSYTLE
jgi:hypothetical protein